MWSSDTAEVFFDDVRIPCNNIIGQEGMGFTYQMLQFQEERLWAAANGKLLISLLRLSPGHVQYSQVICPSSYRLPLSLLFHFLTSHPPPTHLVVHYVT